MWRGVAVTRSVHRISVRTGSFGVIFENAAAILCPIWHLWGNRNSTYQTQFQDISDRIGGLTAAVSGFKWLQYSPILSLPSQDPCITVRDTTFWLSLDRSLSISKGYVKIQYISKGRKEVREADINPDYSGRFGGRRWGRPACWTWDECTKRIDRRMEATTASPTAVQVEWRHFHTNLALKYWAVKKTVTRDTT